MGQFAKKTCEIKNYFPNNNCNDHFVDILLKSESAPLHSHSRRRSSRQNESFTPGKSETFAGKSDNTTESDISSRDEKDEKPRNPSCLPPEFIIEQTHHQFIGRECHDKKTFTLDPKESSKEETVKKWIEDSNKILSNTVLSNVVVKSEEDIKKENELLSLEELLPPQPPPEDEKPSKRGRRTKTTASKTSADEKEPCKKKIEVSCNPL